MMSPTAPAVLTPEAMRARSQGWQRRILELSTLVPEVAGAASLVRGIVSRVRFTVEGGSAAQREHYQEQIDGFDAGRAAELIWLSGEVYVAMPTSGPLYSLSVAEVFFDDPQRREILFARGRKPMLDHTARIWKPSLTNRWHATSPNQAAIDIVEAMYLHQLADSAVATSRLAGAGMIIWPTNLPNIPLRDDGTPAPGSRQALLKELHDAMWQSITNRQSKDAALPFVVFTDPEQGEWMPEMFRIDKTDYADQYKSRFEMYRLRYATAIDMPIQTAAGTAEGSNHWSSWSAREDTVNYLLPTIELLRDGIERRLLRPCGLRLTVEIADIIKKPDQTATVLRLLQLGVIDPAYAFEILDYDPSMSREIPQRAYATQQMTEIPSEFTVGGERGGGALPQ